MAPSQEALLTRARKVPRSQSPLYHMLCMFNCKLRSLSSVVEMKKYINVSLKGLANSRRDINLSSSDTKMISNFIFPFVFFVRKLFMDGEEIRVSLVHP